MDPGPWHGQLRVSESQVPRKEPHPTSHESLKEPQWSQSSGGCTPPAPTQNGTAHGTAHGAAHGIGPLTAHLRPRRGGQGHLSPGVRPPLVTQRLASQLPYVKAEQGPDCLGALKNESSPFPPTKQKQKQKTLTWIFPSPLPQQKKRKRQKLGEEVKGGALAMTQSATMVEHDLMCLCWAWLWQKLAWN